MREVINEIYKTTNYIDPGTGSLIVQILIGAALGGFYLIRNYIKRFINWILGRK